MWSRRRKSDETLAEATAALEDAEKNLQRVKRRGDEVHRVVGALREIRKRNHFGEALEQIILRGKG